MGKTYVCIEPFCVSIHDDDGFYTEKDMQIQKGEKFQISDDDFRLIGGEVRLDSDDSWIEISKRDLDRYFKIVEEEQP